jgi:hypothetical protein
VININIGGKQMNKKMTKILLITVMLMTILGVTVYAIGEEPPEPKDNIIIIDEKF